MKVIKKGSKGTEVESLQKLLVKKGYKVTIDGIFGSGVESAVKDFQKKNKLVADGIVGSGTWALLQTDQPPKAGPGAAPPIPASPTESKPLPDPVVAPVAVPMPTPLSQPVPIPVLVSPPPPVREEEKIIRFLTEQDIIEVAKQLGVEVAAIKAVYEVESKGKGFLSNGQPTILFEGHIFWRQLKNKGIAPEQYVAGNQDILYSKWTKSYYRSGTAEYERLNRAKAIDEEAAIASASWGTFQIMGFNHIACGFKSVKSFVDAHCKSELEHLKAFGKFIQSLGLVNHLRNKNWTAFAKGYNGPAYAQNRYDVKLRQAYEKYKKL